MSPCARGDVVVHALLLDVAEATQFARLTRRLSTADASSILLAARLGVDLAVDDRTPPDVLTSRAISVSAPTS